jgi:hypothetical protein
LIGSTYILSAGQSSSLGVDGSPRCWVSGLISHCRSALRLLGLAGWSRLHLLSCLCLCSCSTFADSPQISLNEEQADTPILCKHCGQVLGKRDASADGWRIWKWCLSISSGPTSSPSYSTYSIQKWISARLLYLIENIGVRKFHIHPPPSPTIATASTPTAWTPSILVWVFTPDLLFSSSIARAHRTDPTRAVKCFFKKQAWAPLQPGEPESATIEDVEFPLELYEELQNNLHESQNVIPATARKFQGWDVGLLERFDVGEEALGEQDEGDQGTEGMEGLGFGDDDERRGRDARRRSRSQESLD